MHFSADKYLFKCDINLNFDWRRRKERKASISLQQFSYWPRANQMEKERERDAKLGEQNKARPKEWAFDKHNTKKRGL